MRDTHRHVGEGERRENRLKKGNSWDAAESWRGRGTSSKNFAGASAPIRGIRFVRFWRVLVVSLSHCEHYLCFVYRFVALRTLTFPCFFVVVIF